MVLVLNCKRRLNCLGGKEEGAVHHNDNDNGMVTQIGHTTHFSSGCGLKPTSTLSQRKGPAPQTSITFSCQAGGVASQGGGVLHDNDADVTA